eukprot:2998677-Pyramimonas_sp.AAC.1
MWSKPPESPHQAGTRTAQHQLSGSSKPRSANASMTRRPRAEAGGEGRAGLGLSRSRPSTGVVFKNSPNKYGDDF